MVNEREEGERPSSLGLNGTHLLIVLSWWLKNNVSYLMVCIVLLTSSKFKNDSSVSVSTLWILYV